LGRFNITQATYGAAYGILITNYGSNSDGSGGSGGAIQFNRQRGNREGNVAVVNGDVIGGALFTAFNGTTAGNAGAILANVNTSFGAIANGSSIPTSITISPSSNTARSTFTFGGDGNLTLPSNTSSINYANGSPYGGGGTNANYANFAGNVTNSAQPNITSVSNGFSSGQLTLNTTGLGNPLLTMNGVVGSSNGKIVLNQGIFQVFNEDLLGGQSPFQFNIFGNSAYQEPINYYRARGTQASPANLVAGDTVLDQRWQVYANSSVQGIFRVGAQYDGFTSGVGAYGRYGFYTGGDTANCTIDFQAGTINLQGNTVLGTSGSNVQVSNTSLFKLSTYTAAALTAITGQAGQIACVTNSAQGSNPNGMIAFWDTTNTRWSYIHDNSAV
jgi:hypothetical protein